MDRTRNFPREKMTGLRNEHKRVRAKMSKDAVQEKSAKICEQLLQADWYADCKVIYGYYPLGNEVDCIPFLKQALDDGKKIALPRVTLSTLADEALDENSKEKKDSKGHMDFYVITDFSQVEEGSFHVMEPVLSCPMAQEQEAIALVPGVVFDRQGNRYGYGGGYYDRYFARFKNLHRIALAYENQMEESIPVLDTDVLMDAVYTESRSYPQIR